MDEIIGLRVKMELRSPDPGREALQLPSESITGTISGSYVGPHGRKYYYVRVEGLLELDANTRMLRVVKGESNEVVGDEHQMRGAIRRSRVVSIATSQDVPPPSRDILGRMLLESRRGEAELVNLIFRRPLPSQIDLSEVQEDARRPLAEADYVDLGYANIEVL